MIEDTCLISREREGKSKWVPLGKTNGILETQAGDKKICDVCLYRYERPFLLLQGLRGIYGRFILFFLRVDPPQRGDLWQSCFRNCCFSQIREASRRRFFCTCWISKVSSLKQSSHQYWGSECVPTFCHCTSYCLCAGPSLSPELPKPYFSAAAQVYLP